MRQIEEVEDFVRGLARKDDGITASGNCRNSVQIIAKQTHDAFPDVETTFLVHPKAQEGFGVHYSLLLSTALWRLIVNYVPAPGFPEFIGEWESAYPTYRQMNQVDQVI